MQSEVQLVVEEMFQIERTMYLFERERFFEKKRKKIEGKKKAKYLIYEIREMNFFFLLRCHLYCMCMRKKLENYCGEPLSSPENTSTRLYDERERQSERERKNARIYIDIEKGTEKNHNIVHTTSRMYTPPIGGKKMVEKKK